MALNSNERVAKFCKYRQRVNQSVTENDTVWFYYKYYLQKNVMQIRSIAVSMLLLNARCYDLFINVDEIALPCQKSQLQRLDLRAITY